MRKLSALVKVFLVLWLIFAVFDFSFDSNLVHVYSMTLLKDRTSGDKKLPKYIANSVREYRILQEQVVSNTDGFVHSYEDCQVFDSDNWSCSFSDDSGIFGARNGRYFSYLKTEKSPHFASYEEIIFISRFRYILLGCQWDWLDGPVQLIACAFRPFMT